MIWQSLWGVSQQLSGEWYVCSVEVFCGVRWGLQPGLKWLQLGPFVKFILILTWNWWRPKDLSFSCYTGQYWFQRGLQTGWLPMTVEETTRGRWRGRRFSSTRAGTTSGLWLMTMSTTSQPGRGDTPVAPGLSATTLVRTLRCVRVQSSDVYDEQRLIQNVRATSSIWNTRARTYTYTHGVGWGGFVPLLSWACFVEPQMLKNRAKILLSTEIKLLEGAKSWETLSYLPKNFQKWTEILLICLFGFRPQLMWWTQPWGVCLLMRVLVCSRCS